MKAVRPPLLAHRADCCTGRTRSASSFCWLRASRSICRVSRSWLGRRPLVQDIHFYSGLGWIAVLVLIVLLGDRRGLLRTAREIDGFDRDDLRWLAGDGRRRRAASTPARRSTRRSRPRLTLLFLCSGVLLWLGERNTRFRFASTVILHDGLMYISLGLLVGHLYLAVIHPATRHALRGITVGTVDEEWATRHHPKWKPE